MTLTLVCLYKVKGAFVVTLMLARAWALGSHFKVLQQSFLCDGQGTILHMDRSCFNAVLHFSGFV